MAEDEINPIHDVAAAQKFLRDFPTGSRNRGKSLFSSGAVRRLHCEEEGRGYTAQVQAHRVFTVSMFYEMDSWDAECTCPKQFDCEHGYAAMSALLAGQAIHSTAQPAKPPGSLLQELIAAAVPRKLRPEESRFLTQLQELYTQCRAKGGIESWELAQLGCFGYGYGWGRVELWPSFPKDDYEFWLYLAHAFAERKLPIPEFLQPLTKLEMIRDGLASVKRRQEIARWQEQLRSHSTQFSQAAGSAGSAVDFRLVLGAEAAQLEWKLEGEPAFKQLKQTTFKRLSTEYTAGTLVIVPEAAPLWHSFSQPLSYNRWTSRLEYSDPEAHRLLNPLVRLPSLQGRLVSREGHPLPRLTEGLRWHLQPAETQGDDYQLRLVLADGSAAPPIWFALPGQPALYVTSAGIYTGPAPVGQLLHAGIVNAIPAPALETPDGLDLVLRLGLELPPRFQQRVERLQFKVKLTCQIKPTYPGGDEESICVRVAAQTGQGKNVEMFTAAGWQLEKPRAAPKPLKQGETIFFYDRSALSAFPGVLETLGLKWEDYRRTWRVRLTKNLPAKFVEWLDSMPREIEVDLDSELATLTQAPAQASVKLDCTEVNVDWFDLKVVVDVSDTELTPAELKMLLDAQGRFVRLGTKGWRRLQFNLSPEEDERLARLGLSATDFSSEPQRLHALQLADKAASSLLPERQVQQIQRRIGELKTRVTPPVPDSVHAELRPYQVEGFHFLAYLTANRFGGILADDMGLGKTLQTLTWLEWLRAQPDLPKKPTLVVCPKSVMDTWLGEAERFTPGLRVKLWRGTDGSALKATLAEADLLVMNYAQLRGLEEALPQTEWLAAILDEGQYIKNPESQTARVARALKADYRLALSGTPIENRLMDLWSLMAFAMPGVLGNRAQFSKRFDQPGDALARRRLSARVRPFLLRRTKAQVATDLPDRIEEDLYCELEGPQKTLYQAEFKRAQQMLLNVRTRKELNEFRFHFLTSLLRLRQICCHPGLYSPEAANAESAKLNAFLELVEPLMQEGHKVLVFSQFVSMLNILRPLVQERNWPHFYLAGDTEDRGQLVREFQAAPGPALFLISLKAGGFGLNLTAASYVVLFDPWWNPAVENQAIDRTHRIGQTSKVIAYRLLTKGSIEEKIRALQRTKSALAADVLGEDSFARSLTIEDLKYLFSEETEPSNAGPSAPPPVRDATVVAK